MSVRESTGVACCGRRVIPTLLLLMVAAVLLASCGRSGKRTRIVLITVDTLRQDALDPEAPAMPRVLRRAREGRQFDQFFASTSTTQPTHATVFTGLHPWQHGVSRNGMVLSQDMVTLTERLTAAGFSTAAVVASFPLHRRFGFSQGFDTYHDRFELGLGGADSWLDINIQQIGFQSLAGDVTDTAVALIDAAVGDRQFYWFHYFDPHAPYGDEGEMIKPGRLSRAARERSDGLWEIVARARAAYGIDVARVDRELDRLLGRLERDAADFETHVFFTADHGESFGEDNSFGHGNRVTRSQVHVPSFLLSPLVQPGVDHHTASSVDVLPTLLWLAGIPGSTDLPGRNLVEPPSVATPVALGMRRSFAKPAKEVRADGSVVRLSGHRFFLFRDGTLHIGDGNHIESDGGTLDAATTREVRRLFSAMGRDLENRSVEELLDSETQSALEGLGYLR